MVSDIKERWKQLQILTSGCKLKPGGGVLIARPCHPRDQLPHSRLKNRYYNKQNLCNFTEHVHKQVPGGCVPLSAGSLNPLQLVGHIALSLKILVLLLNSKISTNHPHKSLSLSLPLPHTLLTSVAVWTPQIIPPQTYLAKSKLEGVVYGNRL
jgi:hypothetical protein